MTGSASGDGASATGAQAHFGGPARRRPAPLGHAAADAAPPGSEVAARRTRTSRTWKTGDGRFHTRVYAAPVNYRDAQGNWSAIDDTLAPTTAAGYAFENRADRYQVRFPDNLGKRPVAVSDGDASVGFTLQGADGGPVAADSTARYKDVLPGVSAAYTAGPGTVKEDLTLADAGAPASYTYALDLGSGLTARDNNRGGIDVVDQAGAVRFTFEAPFATDAAGARLDAGSGLSLHLAQENGAQVMKLEIDRGWLTSADRQFPVVIDPAVDAADNQDCYVVNGTSANTSFCGGTSVQVGWDGTKAYRSLLKFDVAGAVPANSFVVGAHALLYQSGATTATSTSVAAYQVTHSWTSAATWNKYDGTNAWTSAGGDFQSPAEYTDAGESSATNGDWHVFGVTNVVQRWLDGAANYGLLFKEPTENVNDVLSYSSRTASSNAPYIEVVWEPKFMGDQAWYPMAAPTPLGGGQSLAVNADGGNLVVHSADLRIAGTGLPFSVERTYNNLSPDMDAWGYGWSINGGFDMWLSQYTDGQTFYDATGTPFHFTLNSDGSYTSPPGIDATLTANADGTNTVTYHGSHVQINFDDDGDRLTSIKDRNGNTLTYSYNADGTVASVTDTQGRVTTFAYDTASWSPRISQITDSSGRSESYTYWPNGGPLKTFTDGAGKTTTYNYDDDSDLTSVVDGNGNTTQIGYDSSYRVASIKRITDNTTLAGNTTTFTYNNGNTVVTDPLGHTQTYFFDASGRTTKATDGLGRSDQTQYNADNQPTVSTTPLNQSYTDAYDGTFRATSSQQPDVVNGGTNGLKSQLGYDSTITSQSDPRFWLPKTATDTEGNATTYTYDALGNVKTSTDSLGTTSYTYNSDGTAATSTDGNGNTTTYTYTGGNLTKVTPPLPLQPETATYDSLGRPQTTTDGNGVTATFTYDGDDRVTSVAYTGGPTLTSTYDADGNVLATTDPTGTTTNTYDRLSRLTNEAMPNGKTNTYTYDAADNLKTLQDAGGTTSYNYDLADQLTSAQAPGETQPTTFTYYADGSPKDTTYPNGVVTHRAYDNPGRPSDIKSSLSGAALTDFSYTYKHGTADTNLVQSVTDKSGAQTTYGYDTRAQLTSASGAAGHNYTYIYDLAGNMTRSTKDGAATSYGYSPAEMPCWSVAGAQSSSACSPAPTGATTYSYDGAGNMTGSSGGFSAHYNKLSQTTDMTSLTGGSALAFTYRGAGQSQRSTAGANVDTENAFGLSSEQNASGTTCYTYSPDGDLLSERLPVSGGVCNGPRYYYLYNAQDSVAAVTDSSGAVQDTYSYDPYGATTSSGTVPNPWKYAGGYQDSTGFYKFGARYYSPSLMHWTQQDPLGGGCSYADDDPATYSDPSGLIPDCGKKRVAKNRFGTFTITRRGSKSANGTIHYTIQYEARAPFKRRAIYTEVKAWSQGHVIGSANSAGKLLRGQTDVYHAHTQIKVDVGHLVALWGHTIFQPTPLGGGNVLVGNHFHGYCWAR
jgi:RHS repeat-associated protein